MRRRRFFDTLIVALLALLMIGHGSAFAQGNGKGKPPKDDGGGGGGGGGGTEEPALPPVAYVIDIPEMPANSTGGVWINDVNIEGQVVGWYRSGNSTRAFIYDAVNGVRDLNAIVGGGLPDHPESYWILRSAVGINDHGVVVGMMQLIDSSPNQVRPIAIDLDAENPVVDLLPDVGVDYSGGKRINENGDILGTYQTPDGWWGGWLFNPGLYGDPDFREERDGQPLDMRGEEPAFLPDSLFGLAHNFLLNNPVGDLPAQVAGQTSDGVVFRYATGVNPQLELFPQLAVTSGPTGVSGFNDSGTFCGRLHVTEGRRKDWYVTGFRYTTQVDELPTNDESIRDLNSSGDVVLDSLIYRDDWLQQYGRPYVPINDLVTGTAENLATWFSGRQYSSVMSDRVGESDAGVIAGRLEGVAPYPILYVLTPVSTGE